MMNSHLTPVQLHAERMAGRAPDASALRCMRDQPLKKGLMWAAFRNSTGDHMVFFAVNPATHKPESAQVGDSEPLQNYEFCGYVDLDSGTLIST
jgi:hypothetical protein